MVSFWFQRGKTILQTLRNANLGGGGEEAGVLRGERVEGDGDFVAHVDLEVQQRFGENDHVAHLQRGSVQHVVVAHEPRVDAALHHEQRLGCARVRVQRYHPPDGEVQPSVADALRVQPGPPYIRRGQRCDGPRRRHGRVIHITT